MKRLAHLWSRLPLVGRLLTTASFALLVSGATMIGISARKDAENIDTGLGDELRRELDTLPAVLAEPVVIGDFATIQQTLDRYAHRTLVASVAFADTSGTRLVAAEKPVGPAAPAGYLSAFGLHEIADAAPVIVGGRRYGEVQIALSPHVPAHNAWQRLLDHLAILLLAIALDFLGIWLVLRISLRPLQAVTHAVDAVATGRFDTQLALPAGASPELRHLVERFNEMAQAIDLGARQLREARRAAEAAAAAKSRFLVTMSHEIRTPLNGILGMAQLLLADGVSDAERREGARVILHSGQTLLALLNDVLDLSKVEAGKLTIEAGVVDPGELLRETHMLFAATARQKDLELACHWHGPAGRRYAGDPQRLRQMLANLVSNALKFTPKGAVTVEARELPGSTDAATRLEFSVADTGIGIAANQQSLLFQPFSQIDDSATRRYGGTGLGLSIVKNLAKLMGGDVGVESAAGQGARFWFVIPARPLAAAEDTRQDGREAAQPAWTMAAAHFTGRVLVVEDNSVNRLVIEKMLHKLGVDTRHAENGRQALEQLAADAAIDLVLMDVQMPEMDGLSATRALRAREAASGAPRLPVIALTADAFPEDRAACLAAGMDAFLAKPLHLEALVATLAQWLPQAPHAPGPAAAPAPRSSPLSTHEIKARLAALPPLLAEGRYDAVAAFAEIAALAAGTPLADALQAIEPDIRALRFAAAREALIRLLQTHFQDDLS